ncbi:branched-chain amino acid ABC transporter permease [Microbaculum marinisediminis]|uniref:Branched-chain amino acid ABC transporter permease n=1 Tax=Microbaculum marinisediminis TaxID=2931392 RepID=A0AAW5R6J4_9HYPH|nr:branched-chain amino acid ABC transporter permease [Microbaculum sp. A6E488]MCT8974254.1 branched-chain amino acid ABC transporter permease [Microbaculum sp. A6E488]
MRDRIGVILSISVLAAICAAAPLLGEFWSGVLARYVSWMFLAISFTLAYSYANIPSVTQATIFGAGAYVAVWLSIWLQGNLLLIMFAGAAGGALVALVFGSLVLRMSHAGAAIGTIIFAVTFSVLGSATVAVTGGADGLPLPNHDYHLIGFPISVGPNIEMLLLSAAILAAVLIGYWVLSGTDTWRVVRAVQQNAVRAQVLGYNSAYYRLSVFTAAGGLAGLGGALYALISRHVAIDVVSLSMSLKSILWAAVGGVTSVYGGPIGVLVVQLTSEILARWTVRVDLIIGLMLIAIALWLPQGVMGLRNHKRR